MSSWKASGEVRDEEKNPKDLENSPERIQRLEATRHKILKIVFRKKRRENYLQGSFPFYQLPLTGHQLCAKYFTDIISNLHINSIRKELFLVIDKELRLRKVKQVLQSLTGLFLSCYKDWAFVTTPVYSLPNSESPPSGPFSLTSGLYAS